MRDHIGLRIAFALTLVGLNFSASIAVAEESNRNLNVVFILVDDLGWTDLACYGSDFHETPHIDRLAESCLRFSNAYSASPVCSPTRAAILTGKSPARLDMTIWHEGAVDGGPKDRPLLNAISQPNLPHEEVTLAERFRQAGYYTAHIGKWHLGTAAHYPETQGFDLNVGGTFWGAPSTFHFPFSGPWSKSNPEFRYVPGLAPGKPGDYLTDRLTDEAIGVIEKVRDRPFFLSLWYHTVHSPIEGRPDIVESFESRKKGLNHKNAEYAAMVKSLDDNVGRVVEKLEQLNILDQTIVIFTSDNGGVDFPTRSGIPTSNSPLRSGKGTLYEGGIRVPLMIRWPGKTKAKSTCHEMVTSEDFAPTLIEGLGLSHNPKTPDGISLFGLLDSPTTHLDRNTLYWHFPHYYPRMTPGSAIRQDNWKLIHFYEDNRVELYNLDQDTPESHDLAKQRPLVAKRLLNELDVWRNTLGANAPRANPAPQK